MFIYTPVFLVIAVFKEKKFYLFIYSINISLCKEYDNYKYIDVIIVSIAFCLFYFIFFEMNLNGI